MITDALNAFLTRVNLAGTAANATVTSDIIDLGPLFSAARNLGRGQPLRLRVQVEASIVGGPVTIAYADSPNPDGSSPTVRDTGSASATSPAAGMILRDIWLPDNLQRYVFLQVNNGAAAITAGVVTAAIVENSDSPPGQYGWAAQVIGF